MSVILSRQTDLVPMYVRIVVIMLHSCMGIRYAKMFEVAKSMFKS